MLPDWLQPLVTFFVSLLTTLLSLFGIVWPSTETTGAATAETLETAASTLSDPMVDPMAYVDSKEA